MLPSRVVQLLAVAVTSFGLLVYGLACFGAAPIFDDAWGIVHHWPGALLPTLVKEWTQPSYLAQGVDYPDQFAWGPVAMCLQDLLASVTGRETVTPFRLLNVAIFAATLLAVAGATLRLTGSPLAASLAACALGIHPVSAEVVPWAADVFDALAALFLAVGVYATIGTVPSGGGATRASVRQDLRPAFVTLAWFALAVFSKPTAVALGLVFPLLAAAQGASRRAVVHSGLAVLGCALAHQALYARACPWPLGRILAARLTDDGGGARTTLAVAWGAALLDAALPRSPPSLFRFVLPGVEGLRATLGVVAVGLALAACTALRARPWARLGAISLAMWAVGLVPGAYFSTLKGITALRYSYLPLVVLTPLAAAASSGAWVELRPLLARSSPTSRLVVALAVVLAGGVTAGGWATRSAERLAAFGSMGALLTAELGDPAFLTAEAHGSVLRVQAAKAVWFDHITALRLDPSGPASSVCAEGARYAEAIAALEDNPVFARQEQVETLLAALQLNAPILEARVCGAEDHQRLVQRVQAASR